MARNQLILDRYRPIGESRSGGFGTVRVAWDTRIQRKVAIKCIELDEVDAARAASEWQRLPNRLFFDSSRRFCRQAGNCGQAGTSGPETGPA